MTGSTSGTSGTGGIFNPPVLPDVDPYGNFSSMLKAFFGSQTNAEIKQKFDLYLYLNGYSATNQPSDTDPVALAQFIQFASQQTADAQHLTLSPDQYTKDHNIFALYEVIVLMLQTMQNTVAQQAYELNFLTNWQQQYTQEMTQTPIYQLDPGSVKIPQGESAFTQNGFFNTRGNYAGISASGIVDTLFNQRVNLSLPFKLSGASKNGTGIDINNPANDLVLACTWSSDSKTLTIDGQLHHDGAVDEYKSVTVTIDPNKTDEQNKQAIKDAMWSVYSPTIQPGGVTVNSDFHDDGTFDTTISLQVNADAWSLLVPQRWIGGNGSSDDVNIKYRGNENSLLQQYIENSRSRRETIQNQAKQVDSAISQSNEGLNQQTSLLSSILQELQTIMAAIYR